MTGAGFRRGVRLGVDVGEVRVGVARSDPDGVLATPVETVQRRHGAVQRIVDLVVETGAIEIVVGLPLTLAGKQGVAADRATEFADMIAAELDTRRLLTTVRLSDERLTTVSAERALRESGRRGPARRAVVDQAAAVEILQHALDRERSTGVPAGTSVRRNS